MRSFILGALAAGLLAIAACATGERGAHTPGLVRVTGGEVQGSVEGDLAVYKGIPFAAPPVGDLRWRPPQPVAPWQGARAANAFASPCMQIVPDFLRFPADIPSPSEDCLYLNVWAPAEAPRAKLPVMVWIYGGAFSGGGTSYPVYDGAAFARRGVVVVSIAYRVNTFGFMAHPELSAETGRGSGNFGLQDQIAGLKWVRDNVAKFGGDASNVTIFGESAGGIAVSMLAASPQARGLFHRVISESGGSFGPPARGPGEGGVTMRMLADAETQGAQFLAGLGATNIAQARALPAARAAVGGIVFWPNFDGHVLPGDQYELYEAGRQNDTPVLIGTNSDEGSLFVPQGTKATFEQLIRDGYGPHADALFAAYPHATDAEALNAARDVFRDTAFGWPTWAWARLQSRTGRGKVYAYYFDHQVPTPPDLPFPRARGAAHAAEIAYVFGNLAGPYADEDRAMSNLVMSYWVNFARSGDPNGPGLPRWSAFTEAQQNMMFINARPAMAATPNRPQLDALEGYYAWRRAQRR